MTDSNLHNRIHVIESHIVGKKSQATCEDGIVVTDDFAAVIDGSTSKARKQLRPDMRNGRHAMLLLVDVVRQLSATATLQQFCKIANEAFQAEYTRHGLTERHLHDHPEERLTASICMYSRHRREVWMVGDCLCICNDTLHEQPKPHEAVVAARRSQLIHRYLDSGTYTVEELLHHDHARDEVVADIVESCHHQNIDFSVIDGFPTKTSKTLTIAVAEPQEIVMATDGYPALLPTLAESEAILTHYLNEDPLCYRLHQATKGKMEGQVSFDDRAYLRVEV